MKFWVTIWMFLIGQYSVTAQLNHDKLKLFDDITVPITAIVPDQHGVIWITGYSQLLRFDGYDYEQIYTDSSRSESMYGMSLFEDEEHIMWSGGGSVDSEGGDIFKFDPENRKVEIHSYAKLIDNGEGGVTFVLNIANNDNGLIYFGISGMNQISEVSYALVYFDKMEDQLKRFNYPFQNVFMLTSDPDGNIWLKDKNGFYKIDQNQQVHSIDQSWLKEDENFHLMEFGSRGRGWIITNHNQLIAYDPQKLEIESWDIPGSETGSLEITDLAFDPKFNIWMTTNKGLIVFDTVTKSFEHLEMQRLTAIAFDSFDNAWLGTESNGLYRYNNNTIFNSWTHEQNPDKITRGIAYKIFKGDTDIIWIVTREATGDYGLTRYNPKDGSLKPLPLQEILPKEKNIEVMGELYPDQILLRSEQGWALYNSKSSTASRMNIPGITSNNGIRQIYHDLRGNTWFCTDMGLYLMSGDLKDLEFFDLSSLDGCTGRSNIVNNAVEDPGNGLWIWTENGLFLYDYVSNQIQTVGRDLEKGDVFPNHDMNGLRIDRKGIIWVAAWLGGLCRYNPQTGSIRSFSQEHGLAYPGVQGILMDEDNDAIWVSTAGGISRFSISDETFHNFSPDDGIYGSFYIELAQEKTENGFFIFGGRHGVTYLSPENVTRFSPPPNTFITDFKVADKTYIISDPSQQNEVITLSHDQNDVSFDYTGIHFTDPSKNSFSYQLVGYDEDWRQVKNSRSAFYYHLPPGGYNFQVKAANSNGIWSEPETFSFRISPPWWLTWWAYSLYGLIFLIVVFAVDRIQRKRLLEKEQAKSREKELQQAREIEKAYTELKVTQKQLIHSEKMASLGELTAGIAHEIQNPLNFVNNFSDVNKELAEEVIEEIEKGNEQEAEAILKDIIDNEEKILHHGKRADGIVKGMLQHSRGSSGEKELIDINELADEYLRLAYHGLRAKDKSFNADFKTELDPNLPKINVVPQDIGRVLLNLINNAFYAVSQKAEAGSSDYKPEATVSTKLVSPLPDRQAGSGGGKGEVKISIKDNGLGIPEDIKDKIFQPFFTTKSTGEGTGLGLSLSYDIVTKGHGGELKVETKEGEGSEFLVILPVS